MPRHHASRRVGPGHCNQTAYLGMRPAGVYLQRPLLKPAGRLLYIPYNSLQLKERGTHRAAQHDGILVLLKPRA